MPAVEEHLSLATCVSLTHRAAERVARQLQKRGKGCGIRVAVKKSGCSGYAYQLEYVDEPAAKDLAFECHGVTLFVDQESFPFLQGTQLDFVREGLNEGFQFENPNVKASCGCGESFSV